MSTCTVPGCGRDAVAQGLCPMHYMRKVRHGDPNAEYPPGRPPRPRPADPELDALRRDNAALREQVAVLLKAASRGEAVADAKTTLRRLTALAHENETLKAQLAKAEADPDERIAELQRQLKAACTRINHLRAESAMGWAASRANPAVISKADHVKLIKVFHPDSEARVSKAREAQLTEAAQIFNAIKFKITD
jgi:hypothetical protein